MPRPTSLTFTFTINSLHGPALVSAIEEISNELGGRLEGSHKFTKEGSLTRAVIALGILRSALHAQLTKEGDPQYA